LPPLIAFRIVDLSKPVAFAAAATVYVIAAHPYLNDEAQRCSAMVAELLKRAELSLRP
jgi:hypothetical protein